MTEIGYFCVDAGATRSRGRLYDPAGVALADAEDGPANASYDLDRALQSVRGLWEKLCAATGSDPSGHSATTFSIGGAGLYVRRTRDAFVARVPAFKSALTM